MNGLRHHDTQVGDVNIKPAKLQSRRTLAVRIFIGLGLILLLTCTAVIIATTVKESVTHGNNETEIQKKTGSESFLSDHPDKESWLECHGADIATCREVKKLEEEVELEFQRLYAPKSEKITDGSADSGQHFAQDNPLTDGINTEPAPAQDQEPEEQIYLTPDQLRSLRDNLRSRGQRRQKRKLRIFTSKNSMWELPIQYKFDGSHSDEEKEKIRGGIRHWEAETCIRFVEIDPQTTTSEPHLMFTSYFGCGSYIGRVAVNPQQVDLVSRCISSMGTVAHELGHAIGFWHEHQRSDRDGHINIHPENAWKTHSFVTEFERLGQTNNLVPYDYGSVLHYRSKMLSINGKFTIETQDPAYQRVIGQRVGLSYLDSKLANLAYCQGQCRTPLPHQCKRNGYQDPNDCTRCRCPDGFDGTYCDQVAPGVGVSCGGRIQVGSEWQRIESPGYSHPRNYDDFQACSWHLVAPVGYQLVLMFEEDFGLYCKDLACYHWAEIRFTSDLSKTGARFCCQVRPLDPIRSESHEVMVLFRSNVETYIWSRRGFRLAFYAEAKFGSAPYPPAAPPTTTTTTTTTTTATTTTTTTTTRGPKVTSTHRQQPPPQPSNPKPHSEFMIDLVFLLDSSGSVGAGNWDKMLYFVVMFIRAIEVGPQKAQVSVISYGNSAILHFDLDDYGSSYGLLRAVDSIPWKDQMTNTSGAIKLAHEVAFSPAKGDRQEAPNVVILITDGESNRDKERTRPEAEMARWAGIKMFAIGMGNNLNMQEIEGIVSSPIDKHLYLIRYFDDMLAHLDVIKSEVFSYAGSTSTSTSTSTSFNGLPSGTGCDSPGRADIALILDTSGSVGQVNWYKMLDFIKALVRKLDINDGTTHIGIVSFGSRAFLEFHLDTYRELDQLIDAIDNCRWRDEMTNTSGGIKETRRHIFNINYGDRLDAPNIGIIITDGASNRDTGLVRTEADQARSQGISLLAIGVGNQLNINELRDIVGPQQDRIVFVNSFDRLFTIESELLRLMCSIAGGSSSSSSTKKNPALRPPNPPEVAPPTGTGCRKVDLTFVVDSSGSIGQNNWPRMLHFIRSLVEGFTIGFSDVLVSVVTFSNRATLHFGLQTYPDLNDLASAIDHIQWKDQWTNTSGGLRVMHTEAFGSAGGSRSDASKIGILITDGRSNKDEDLTLLEAQRAKAAGVTLVAVGVGKDVDLDELMGIATDPDSRFMFFADSFTSLPSLIQEIHDLVCYISRTVTSGSVPVQTPTPQPPLPILPNRPPDTSTSRQKCQSLDLTFLIDASSNKDNIHWGKLKHFVKDFVSEIDIGESANNVAFLSYAQSSFVEFYLNEFYSKQSILDAIDDIPQMDQWRDPSAGFYVMRSQVFTEVHGDRPKSKNIGIVITDGRTNRNQHLAIPEAQSLKGLNTELYVVGVTTNVDADELVQIASSPDVTHAFFARSYDDLKHIKTALLNAICGPAASVDTGARQGPVTTTTPTYIFPAGIKGWGTWSECTNQCGGCGRRFRYARCPDPYGTLHNCGDPQEEPCNPRTCSPHDICHFVVASRQYTRPCQECCQGYRRHGDTCIPR